MTRYVVLLAAAILAGVVSLAAGGCGSQPAVTLPENPAPLPKPEDIKTTTGASSFKVDPAKK
jgi:hypothetical protein